MNCAILGSGAIGTALARRFVAKSIDITIANTKGPQSLAGLVSELGPIVRPVTVSEALQADVVILAIPFDAVRDAVKDVEWERRIVVDATNAIDFAAFSPRDLKGRLSTQIVADAVPGARVVKAFNTLAATILGADPVAHGGRRVLFGSPSWILSTASASLPSIWAVSLRAAVRSSSAVVFRARNSFNSDDRHTRRWY